MLARPDRTSFLILPFAALNSVSFCRSIRPRAEQLPPFHCKNVWHGYPKPDRGQSGELGLLPEDDI